MFLVPVLRNALCLLVPLSLLLTSYLYLYPVFHLCAFPAPEEDNISANSAYLNTLRQHLSTPHTSQIAPFRLLTLGDPQLEGDSSIDDVEAATFPHFFKFWRDARRKDHSRLERLRRSLHDLIDFYLDDIPKAAEVWRKRIDHFGNDYYLGHIYRTLHWWTNPTHVTVLGDLVGSQWIDDAEFEHRGWRYWNRVFRGGLKVEEELASQPAEDFQDTLILGEDAAAWKKRIINVAGNHDIGYAGDLSQERMARFTRVFGKANYELRFQHHVNSSSTANHTEGETVEGKEQDVPELRIIVLNDMNLDTPASSKELQDETYHFLNEIITTSHDVDRRAHFTIVLTHIPLYKPAGVCVDGPFFDFFEGDFDNGVKEQNHLSRDASKGFVEGIFGMSGDAWAPGLGFGRNGVVLNGHDHEGCEVYHYINQSSDPVREWRSTRWENAGKEGCFEGGIPGLREITVRSMMGAFGGNAGLLSLWFDEASWEWRFEFANCRMGKQHWWWAVHIIDFIAIGVGVVYGALLGAQKVMDSQKKPVKMEAKTGKVKGLVRRPTLNGVLLEGKDIPKVNGNLDAPGAGKKSLRKKKSRAALNALNGASPSPSPGPSQIGEVVSKI